MTHASRKATQLLLGIGCVGSSLAVLPAVEPRPQDTTPFGHAVWQPRGGTRTIALPAVGASTAVRSGGMQSAAAVPSDPLPSSPWREQPQASPTATRHVIHQPTQVETQPAVELGYPQDMGSADQHTPLQLNAPLTVHPTVDPYRSAATAAPSAESYRSALQQPMAEPTADPWGRIPKGGVVISETTPTWDAPQTTQQTPPTGRAATVSYAAASNADGADATREQTAARISRNLLASATRVPYRTPVAIENPRGWTAVGEELMQRLERCDSLLRRGAIQSARREAIGGLQSLSRAIDAREADWHSEPALHQALSALEEQEDFYAPRRPGTATDASLIAGHQTPVLKDDNINGISPAIAAQHYRAYAGRQLIESAAGHPWAADMCYALGKTYDAEADVDAERAAMLREQAICCYSAALQIQDNHPDAANQLGYSLLRLDRIEEAQTVLTSVVSATRHANAWRNLAEVYRRRGDGELADRATAEALAIDTQAGRMVDGKPMPQVMELSPEEFARISPNLLQPADSAVPAIPVATPIAKATAAKTAQAASAAPVTAVPLTTEVGVESDADREPVGASRQRSLGATKRGRTAAPKAALFGNKSTASGSEKAADADTAKQSFMQRWFR